MSITIDEKRIFNSKYNTSENSSVITQSESAAKTDKAELTQSANLLTSLPINLSDSKFVEKDGNFSFNFTFNESRFQNITANGNYSSIEKNLSVNLRFIIEKELYEGDQKNSKFYQVDFSINASNLDVKSLSKRIEKEDIHVFLNRVLNDLTKMLNDDKINVTGILFDKEDLTELLNLGDKEIGKLLAQIFLIIQTLANIKKYKNPHVENVLFTPKRISQKIMESTQIKAASFDMKMSIEEIDSDK